MTNQDILLDQLVLLMKEYEEKYKKMKEINQVKCNYLYDQYEEILFDIIRVRVDE